ncbi:MAG: AI-2E family transporter, partial [Micrococcaceae bacterium]|nr:AI-2E family transporter [Micrococcaceae bacterium]
MALSPGPGHRNVTGDLPYGVRIAAAWSWRVAIIVATTGLLLWLLSHVSLLVIPLMIAALLAGLLMPVVRLLRRWKLPNGLATGVTMLVFLAVITTLLSLVGRTMARGMMSLWQQALAGAAQVQHWLSSGPLQLSNQDLDRYLDGALTQLQSNSDAILSGAVSWGSDRGHGAAGLML